MNRPPKRNRDWENSEIRWSVAHGGVIIYDTRVTNSRGEDSLRSLKWQFYISGIPKTSNQNLFLPFWTCHACCLLGLYILPPLLVLDLRPSLIVTLARNSSNLMQQAETCGNVAFCIYYTSWIVQVVSRSVNRQAGKGEYHRCKHSEDSLNALIHTTCIILQILIDT